MFFWGPGSILGVVVLGLTVIAYLSRGWRVELPWAFIGAGLVPLVILAPALFNSDPAVHYSPQTFQALVVAALLVVIGTVCGPRDETPRSGFNAPPARMTVGYWITSLGLIVFGIVGAWSIGKPFLLVGLAMLLLGPFRRHSFSFWPPLLAVIAYNIGFWTVAPLYCSATSEVGSVGTTVCTSLIGIRYTGEGNFNPSSMPGVIAGVIFAAVTAIATVGFLLWQRRTRTSRPIGERANKGESD